VRVWRTISEWARRVKIQVLSLVLVLKGQGKGRPSLLVAKAKRKLSLSTRERSELDGVVNQAVRQIAAALEPDDHPWSRALILILTPISDGLLMVTSSDSR
jgi:hypothetical protein